MGIAKKLVSAALACSIAGSLAASSSSWAADIGNTDPSVLYDNTFSSESKGVSAESPFNVFDIYNAYQQLSVTTAAPPVTTTAVQTTEAVTTTVTPIVPNRLPPGQYRTGVDVSEHQSYIDWFRLKNSGEVDFAIIRAGYGEEYDQKDKQFDNNIKNATAAGMDFGIYWYSYALDAESARREAEVCISMLEGYSFNYPVYYDIEDSTQTYLSTAQLSAIADVFCSTLEEHGYYAGIYSCASWLQCKIYEKVRSKYDIWVADYSGGVNSYYGDYGIWQYSSKGRVSGISTIVDMNYSYRDYPAIIGVNPSYGSLPANSTTTTTTTSTTTVSSSAAPVQSTTTTAAPPVTSPQEPVSTAPIFGAKISYADGKIDWDQLKNDGVDFALIKVAESGETADIPWVDRYYYRNLQGAQSRDIKVGVYWHSRALTVEDMITEAEWLHTFLFGINPEYPLYLDLSDPIYVEKGVSKTQMSALIKAFCSYLEGLGYYVGVYGLEDYLSYCVDTSLYSTYDVWLEAKPGVPPYFAYNYGVVNCTQYKLFGENGEIELLRCFRDYPSVMRYYHLNGF